MRALDDQASGDGPDITFRDGRYEGGNGQLFVELRLDLQGTGLVSADVHQAQTARREYVASICIRPGGMAPETDGSWPAVWHSNDGGTTTGWLSLAAVPGQDAVISATLRLDRRLNGLPGGVDLVVVAQRVGEELRHLGVESEWEDGVARPAPVQLNGARLTFSECLRRAGFDVHDIGQSSPITKQPAGWKWDDSTVFTVLNDLMRANAQTGLLAPSWQVHLLMLSRPTVTGVFGVMFDAFDELPRQGCAVFADEIRVRKPPDERDRKILQTTVHELGHALNLAHRFERELGRADSTSFMNYDWQYRGGGRIEEFWRKFDYRFDPDELAFLRHAPRRSVMPGAAPFHSVDYWTDSAGGYSAFVPEASPPNFELALTPPPAGPVFAFGQPVFLQVSLTNLGQRAVVLPDGLLDVKAGSLEILVQRGPGGSGVGLHDATPFVPLMQRCMDLNPDPKRLGPKKPPLVENVNVWFGAGGFTMPEPGTYRLTPLLTIMDRDERDEAVAVIVRGRTLTIRIAYPESLVHERQAFELLRPDVGAWFALGGNAALPAAHKTVVEIGDDRRASHGLKDPIASTIVRALGIDATRSYLRFRDGGYTVTDGSPGRANELLGALTKDNDAMLNFDAATAEKTLQLAAAVRKHRRRAGHNGGSSPGTGT